MGTVEEKLIDYSMDEAILFVEMGPGTKVGQQRCKNTIKG
jgi:hypothetical protein